MRTISAVLCFTLVGCQTTSYQEYALAQTRIAEAQAAVAREQTIAMMALARDPQAGETTRTVAVLMLALGVQNNKAHVSLQPPMNEALEWTRVLLPTIATLGLGYWGYKTAVTQSNNQAATTQASYAAFAAFKPVPQPFVPTSSTVNNITTTSNTDLWNRDGFVIVGGTAQQAPTSGTQDNSPPPVVIVPPVFSPVPVTPVIPGP